MSARITPANALKLSAWLAVHEPTLFRQLSARAPRLPARRIATRLGRFGRLGFLGDDAPMAEVTVTADAAPSVDFSNVDTGSFSFDPTLTDIAFDPGSVSISQSSNDALVSAIAAPTDSTDAVGSSFWDSIASGAQSAMGAIGKVAGALIAPGTIAAAGQAASSYFNAQARTAATQTQQAQLAAQQAAVQAQMQRVAAGGAPAAITYTRDPVTGALTPVYLTSQGARTVTPTVAASLANPSSLPPQLLIGGAIALAVGLALMAAR